MPEISTEVVMGVLVALFGGYSLFKDKLPSKKTLLSYFKFKKNKSSCVNKISNLNKLWAIREDFDATSPVYENLTQAIENLIRQEKEKEEKHAVEAIINE